MNIVLLGAPGAGKGTGKHRELVSEVSMALRLVYLTLKWPKLPVDLALDVLGLLQKLRVRLHARAETLGFGGDLRVQEGLGIRRLPGDAAPSSSSSRGRIFSISR